VISQVEKVALLA
jgi:DNA invertase Pin-like site-specific DNA recombinase